VAAKEPAHAASPPYAEQLRALLATVDRGNMTDAVTEALREAILSGVLVAPAWLREDDLAAALNVSRTPIREALRRLSDEGLTARVANRGTVVTSVTIDEVLAVYAVRESLEGLAARTAALRRPVGLVDQLRAIFQRMEEALDADPGVMAELSFEFHAAIRDASGNAYLIRFLNHAEQVIRRFGRTTFAHPGRPDEALAEHLGLLEAIASGDAGLAEERATEHMRKAREIHVSELLTR
jgi:DNA-binding GntR family transcriptional regulator